MTYPHHLFRNKTISELSQKDEDEPCYLGDDSLFLSTLQYFEIHLRCVGMKAVKNQEPVSLGSSEATMTKIILELYEIKHTIPWFPSQRVESCLPIVHK